MIRFRLLSTALSILIFPIFSFADDPGVIGHWSFEGKAGQSAIGHKITSRVGKDLSPGEGIGDKGRMIFAEEVSGSYIYDPISGESFNNKSSLHFAGDAKGWITIPKIPATKSFTLELFVQPAPRFSKETPIAMLSAKPKRTSEAGLITDRTTSYTWLGAMVRPLKGRREEWNVGYYLGSGRITQRERWRHMALVYDAEKKEVTYWLDHFQKGTRKLSAPLDLSKDITLYIGGTPKGQGFCGHIDEVRLTQGTLPRTKFLRARDTAAENIQFETNPPTLPEDSGYIDLKGAFGAAGDGKTDDTRAFREAFYHLANKVPLRRYVLYIPPGEYLISDEIRWTRFLFVRGAGRKKTIIRLQDKCSGYGDANNPKGVLTVAWRDFTPKATGNAGNNIGSYLHDLTIDVGKENPGAVGLSYHSNNHGSVTNVTIRSSDGKGWAGLAFADNWPGPSLIKNVTIRGFDKGIYSIVGQYSLTFKDLILEKQNEVGIYNRRQMLWIDGLLSRNKVPVMDAGGIIVLVNGRFKGGEKGETAIKLEGGYGLYRNLDISGYSYSIRRIEKENKKTVLKGERVDEQVFGRMTKQFPSPMRSLNLPIKSPPSPPDLSTSPKNILDFEDKAIEGDWGPAIQAAVDSGADTLYLPNQVFLTVRSSVHLRNKVHKLFGFYSGVRPHKEFQGPVFIYDHPNPKHVLTINHFETGRFHHASPGTLVIRDTSTDYTNKPGSGNLFAENTQGKYRITKQDAWFWQLNTEFTVPNGRARFENDGGKVVIVGMKTEKPGSNILTRNGGLTELLGGYFYPNSGTGGQPSIIIDNAGFSGTWRNYWARYKPVVRETRGKKVLGGGERYQGLYSGFAESQSPRRELEPYGGRKEK